MLESLVNLVHLILSGQFNGPIFGLFEDNVLFQPFYFVHQNPVISVVVLSIVAFVLMSHILKNHDL